ncbi:hypothetical protein L873DRAFT_1805673 [Choiromyces venosus 120613-1]|uniref:RanBP2-type domain-containing protein n=1 Tax=Choiromyces venosus 120613-1 TaxID=1336337 RepID=A0A3N4JVP6_9PEZI|nr:hypothetical protein L873DRAFT_1805673 [Choiromyces venosus 120613-1]
MRQSNTAGTGSGYFLTTTTTTTTGPIDERHGRHWQCCYCESANQKSDPLCRNCGHRKCGECFGFNGAD